MESYLHLPDIRHYLDDFIIIAPPNAPTGEVHKSYKELTDLLGVPRNDRKDAEGTTIIVLGIEIDTNLFIARLPEEKLHRARALTTRILSQQAVSLSELQSLAGLLSFAAKVVRLGWVFMRQLWNFEMAFPLGKSREIKRRIPTSIRNDLNWWNTLLPDFNGVFFFNDPSRQVVQLYTDACPKGLDGFFYTDASTFWTKANIRLDAAFMAQSTEAHHIYLHEI